MHCTACDTVNDDNARFCRACGTPFEGTQPRYVVTNAPMTGAACPACSRRNPASARFCVFCATPLAPSGRTTAVIPAAQSTAGGSATAVAYAPAQPLVINFADSGVLHLLLRAIWFFFVGWWLGLIWTIIAWLFNLTLIGLPIGLMMLNVIPQIMTLRPRSAAGALTAQDGTMQAQGQVEQPLALRALWFVFVGWWASLLWMLVAWSFCASILLMPIAFWMFDRVPTITTLAAE